MRPNWMMLFAVLCFALPAQAEMKVRTARLGHGVEAWYVQNDAVPIVDVMLNFAGAGSASDPEGKGGRAGFTAAMLTEGAGEYGAQAFAEALDEKAISIAVNANADQLNIHIRCLREHSARAGELVALMLKNPQLAETDMARVKMQITSLLSQLEERPEYQASKLLNARAFKNHPYANLPYGTAQSVAGLGAQDVRDYLGTYVNRGNLIVSAAGDVDAKLLQDMLEPVVDALAGNDSGAVAVTQTMPQGGGETLKEITTLPQTVISFVGPGITRSDKRFYAAYLLNHIIGGGSLTSRLGMALRQKNGLAYGVDTDLDIRRGAAMFGGDLATRNATADEALAALKAELAKIREQGVSNEECKDAKSYVLGHFPLQLERTSAVSGILFTMQLYKLGEDYLTERTKYFEDVSCADINAVAHDLLAPEKMLFAIVGGTKDSGPAPTPAAPAPSHQ